MTQGVRVSPAAPDGVEVWAKPLASGAVAVVFLNRSPEPRDIVGDFATLGLSAKQAKARDLVLRKDLGEVSGSFTAKGVPPHGVVAVTLTPQ